MNDSSNTKTKITFQIHVNTLNKFNYQMKSLFMKRDDFLNYVINIEAKTLAKDSGERKQSDAARKFITKKFKQLRKECKEEKDNDKEFKKVNVVVDKETADLLNAVVEKTNMVRDCFINRLMYFLISAEELFDEFGMPKTVDRMNNLKALGDISFSYESMSTMPLKAIAEAQADPLYYIKGYFEHQLGESMYLQTLRFQYPAFECFVDDSMVPGTDDFKRRKQYQAEQLNLLNLVD